MMIAVALAALAVAPPGPDPGRGTRLWTEIGVMRFSGAFEASRANTVGTTGIDGLGARVRSGLGFPVGSGFFLGPSAGLDYTRANTSGTLCCGTIKSVIGARIGLEGAFYPSITIGFRVSGGFGLAVASLHADERGREGNGALTGVSAYGSYWTVAIARDYNVGARTRIGLALRLESEVLTGSADDHVYHLRTFTPSLSLVVISQLAG